MQQGRSNVLNPLPGPVAQGLSLATAPTGALVFMGPLEQQRAHWGLSWRAPASLAAELNAKLKDPSSAQVGPWLHAVLF